LFDTVRFYVDGQYQGSETQFLGCLPPSVVGGLGGFNPRELPQETQPTLADPFKLDVACGQVSSNGSIRLFNTKDGERRFQFDSKGSLIGVAAALTTGNGAQPQSGISIPPNTLVGIGQPSPGSASLGFSNPVHVGSGVTQAYIQSFTFSQGKFTSVVGAYAPFGIAIGSSNGESDVLRNFLNGKTERASQAQQIGGLLSDITSIMTNFTCKK
jgi:hypothetical protein